MFAYLPHVAELHQIGQQPVAGAARNAQLVRQRAQRLPLWSCRQIFENLKRTLGEEDMVWWRGRTVSDHSEASRISFKMEQYSKWNAMSVLCEPVSTPHKEAFPCSIPSDSSLPPRLPSPASHSRRPARQRSLRPTQERTIKFGHLNNPDHPVSLGENLPNCSPRKAGANSRSTNFRPTSWAMSCSSSLPCRVACRK